MKSEEQFPFLNSESEIPDEIICKIFDFLTVNDLTKISLVNRRSYFLARSYTIKYILKELDNFGFHLTSNMEDNDLIEIF